MPLPLLALGLAAGGAAVAGGAGAAGVGKNTYRSSNFADTKHYDANRFEYGGAPGGANEAAGRYRGMAEGAQGRAGEQVNYGLADQSRGGQAAMASLMDQRARGLVPSIAQQQADRQMQQATAAQASAAASARGAGGLALAQQNAANNTAMMQSSVSNQAQINAAQERMAAEQAAFGAYSGMRGADAQQAQYQAQLNAQQRAQNDAYTLGMTGYETGVRGAQLNAGQQQQGILAGQHMGAQTTNAQINGSNANREMDYLKLGLGMAQGGADAGTAIGKRASGGPVTAGKPYLVGELGPELIVPQSDGTVIPSGTTMGLLGSGGGPGSGPAQASIDRLNPDASMNVLGSLRAHSNTATRFARDPSGGMAGGGLFG